MDGYWPSEWMMSYAFAVQGTPAPERRTYGAPARAIVLLVLRHILGTKKQSGHGLNDIHSVIVVLKIHSIFTHYGDKERTTALDMSTV
jgi:hypothetical protein